MITTLAMLWALLLPRSAPAAPVAEAGGQLEKADSLMLVPADLSLSGHAALSTARLRRLLGAGREQGPAEWRARLDSLAAAYADLGRPFLDWREQVDSSAVPRRLASLELEEGPRLRVGRLVLDPPRPDLPDPAQELPPGTLVTGGRLEEGLRAWLERLDRGGRPLALVQPGELSLVPDEDGDWSLDLRLRLADADTVRPGRLVVLDAGTTRQRTFDRLSRLRPGAVWDPARAADARRRLLATGWFSRLEGPELCRTPQGLAWLVRAEELPAYRLDGLLAWLPEAGGGGRLGYHLSIDLANLVGTGRELQILASRPEGWSQRLRVAYREPFIGGWPVDAGLAVAQRIQDSTWVEQELALDAGWEPRPGWRLSGGLVLRGLTPDSLNGYRRAGMDASRAALWTLTLAADQRDDPRNPRRGWRAGVEETALRRRVAGLRGLPARGEDVDLHRQRVETAVWWPAGGRLVLHGLGAAGRFRGRGAPGREDQFLLGGLAGPRGARDESIRAREWVLAQVEWRLLLGPAARAALFWDHLAWRGDGPARQGLQGRGAALVLPVRQGQLEVQYALTPGIPWRQGLLHVRVLTRF